MWSLLRRFYCFETSHSPVAKLFPEFRADGVHMRACGLLDNFRSLIGHQTWAPIDVFLFSRVYKFIRHLPPQFKMIFTIEQCKIVIKFCPPKPEFVIFLFCFSWGCQVISLAHDRINLRLINLHVLDFRRFDELIVQGRISSFLRHMDINSPVVLLFFRQPSKIWSLSLPQRKIRSAVIFVVLRPLTPSQSPQSVSLKSDLHDTYATMALHG